MDGERIDLSSELSVLDKVVEKLRGVFHCSGVALLLAQKGETEWASCVASTGGACPFRKGDNVALADTPADRLARGERFVILGPLPQVCPPDDQAEPAIPNASLWLPIRAEEGYFGILVLMDMREGYFTGDEIPMLDIVASQVASIINLYSRLDEVTIKDEATGLYNVGYFRRRLVNELERSIRYGSDLSLVLVTVAATDKEGDAASPELSEAVVRCTADALVYSLRTSDVLARLDESTVVALLPETSAQGAAVVAARVGAQIARGLAERVGDKGHFEIGVGAASRRPDSDTAEELITRARQNARRAAAG